MLAGIRNILKRLTGRSAAARYLARMRLGPEITSAGIISSIERLLHAMPVRRKAAAAELTEAMSRLRPHQWPHLRNDLLACGFDGDGAYPGLKIHKSDLEWMEQLPRDSAVTAIGIASLSRNGYLRESALQALARLEHPHAAPYVL